MPHPTVHHLRRTPACGNRTHALWLHLAGGHFHTRRRACLSACLPACLTLVPALHQEDGSSEPTQAPLARSPFNPHLQLPNSSDPKRHSGKLPMRVYFAQPAAPQHNPNLARLHPPPACQPACLHTCLPSLYPALSRGSSRAILLPRCPTSSAAASQSPPLSSPPSPLAALPRPLPPLLPLLPLLEGQQAAEQEVLHDGELGQHLHLVHLDHAAVHLGRGQEGRGQGGAGRRGQAVLG